MGQENQGTVSVRNKHLKGKSSLLISGERQFQSLMFQGIKLVLGSLRVSGGERGKLNNGTTPPVGGLAQ